MARIRVYPPPPKKKKKKKKLGGGGGVNHTIFNCTGFTVQGISTSLPPPPPNFFFFFFFFGGGGGVNSYPRHFGKHTFFYLRQRNRVLCYTTFTEYMWCPRSETMCGVPPPKPSPSVPRLRLVWLLVTKRIKFESSHVAHRQEIFPVA